MMRSVAIFLACSTVRIKLTQAQQKPFFDTVQFNTSGVTHRQDVCDRQQKLNAKEVTLRNALNGLALRPGVFQDEFFNIDENGAIDSEDPGIIAELLDELGRRANFTWRDSFGTTVKPNLMDGRTFTDLLVWTSNTYDMTADWYPSTGKKLIEPFVEVCSRELHLTHDTSVERLELGINFQQAWYDSNIIMVTDVDPVKSKNVNIFSWVNPFDAGVWMLIVATIVFSALVYQGLEYLDHGFESKGEVYEETLLNLFLTTITFTGHFEYKPRGNPARLLAASLTFTALLVSSAYTANLASFLVFRNQPDLVIRTIDDVVKNEQFMCVSPFTDARDTILKRFPFSDRFIVLKETEAEMFLAVRRGECRVAVTTAVSWSLHEVVSSANPDCTLARVGEIVAQTPSSFAFLSDSGTRCTSLIRDVLHLHMTEMVQEGYVNNLWQTERAKRKDVSCISFVAGETAEETAEGHLTLQDMGGVFVTHYIITGLVVCYTLLSRAAKIRVKDFFSTQQENTNKAHDQLQQDATLGADVTRQNSPSDRNIQIEAAIALLRSLQEDGACPTTGNPTSEELALRATPVGDGCPTTDSPGSPELSLRGLKVDDQGATASFISGQERKPSHGSIRPPLPIRGPSLSTNSA